MFTRKPAVFTTAGGSGGTADATPGRKPTARPPTSVAPNRRAARLVMRLDSDNPFPLFLLSGPRRRSNCARLMTPADTAPETPRTGNRRETSHRWLALQESEPAP